MLRVRSLRRTHPGIEVLNGRNSRAEPLDAICRIGPVVPASLRPRRLERISGLQGWAKCGLQCV
jgi:hypothetical protein